MKQIITLLFISFCLLTQAQQPHRRMVVYYEAFDSVGILRPVQFEYLVLTKDSTIKDGYFKKFSKEGDLIMECKYKQNLLDSIYREFFENGVVHYEIFYKDGYRNGTSKVYDIRGNLQYTEDVKNVYTTKPHTGESSKVLVGSFERRNFANVLIAKGELKEDKPHGQYEEYYPSGNLKLKQIWIEGKKEGPFEIYNDKKQIIQSGFYTNNTLDKEIKTYYPGGELKSTAEYKYGDLNGHVQDYYPSGKLRTDSWYKNNTLDSLTKRFYEDGVLASQEYYKNGRLEGYYVMYYPNGKKKEESVITDNEKNGMFRMYNEAGIKTLEGNYTNGVLNGENL